MSASSVPHSTPHRAPEADVRFGKAPFRVAVALVAWTILLILMGAMVTSTGSGMAYKDWPLADGQWLPESSYRTLPGFFEHFHRIVGAVAGVLSLGLVIDLGRRGGLRAPAGRAALLGLLLVIVQGVIGGVGVLLGTPTLTSSLHGTLAQITIGVFAVTAYRLSDRWRATTAVGPAPGTRRRAAVGVGALLAQTAIGAIARHSGSAHALWTHAGNALVVFLLVLIAAGLAAGRLAGIPGLAGVSRVLMGLLVVQVVLGFIALLVRTGKSPQNVEHLLRASLISSHVLIGALLTVTASLLAAHVYRGTTAGGGGARG